MLTTKSGGVEQQFYIGLMIKLLVDFADTAHQKMWLSYDIREIERRIATRGLPNLIAQLALLWKAVLSGLETGTFKRPLGFSPKKSSELPCFLQGILTLIFHDDGLLRQDADPHALQECAQICHLLYKLELPFTPSQEQAVIDAFVSTEADLQVLELPTGSGPSIPCGDEGLARAILNNARRLVRNVFKGFDPKDIFPKHGPGAVATGEKHNEKYAFKRKYASIHQCYPYYSYFTTVGTDAGPSAEVSRVAAESVLWIKSLAEAPYGVAKVILVPKDARGPRLISSEPLEFQWIQGGLGQAFKDHVERNHLTKGFVNFTDQEVNRDHAMLSSMTKLMATLDLKEASDRVSVDLVRELFPAELFRHLMAVRSDATRLPSGEVLALNKYAPMGSALCFPVLAVTVWALAVSILQLTIRPSDSNRCLGFDTLGNPTDVFVYGDDLVVPTAAYDVITAWLPRFGLKVNTDKSFHRSNFRESCGMDAFKGIQVTPIRVKKRWTTSSSNGSQLEAYTATMNRFYAAGYWNAFEYLRFEIERVFGPLPYGTATTGYPCVEVSNVEDAERLMNLSRYQIRRWSTRYQRMEYLVKVTADKTVSSEFVDPWQRCLHQTVKVKRDAVEWDDPTEVVVPRSTVIKTRMMVP